jgi:hypothetical protein
MRASSEPDQLDLFDDTGAINQSLVTIYSSDDETSPAKPRTVQKTTYIHKWKDRSPRRGSVDPFYGYMYRDWI